MAIQTQTATFTGVEDSVSVLWPTPFLNPPRVVHGVCITDGTGAVAVFLNATPTANGCTVETDARFNGVVTFIAIGI